MTGGAHPHRIAILTHSTNARGGVVHALELAEALLQMGHKPIVHAPDRAGLGFFRPTAVPTVSVPTSTRASGDVVSMVEALIADYVRYFEDPRHRRFDVFHAQDGISGNALATLKERGLIRRYVRTVHHIDAFGDARLCELDRRSIDHADDLFVVSRLWQTRLITEMSRAATLVGNGVDTSRYCPVSGLADDALRSRLSLGEGPVLLSVGGVEQRKNTLGILDAFRQVRPISRSARLLIAGGASLLDHGSYRRQFRSRLRDAGLASDAVIETGPVADKEMPSLYRLADVLVFPSFREGFGLAVLEAMASGVPVVTSNIPPFTEYLDADDAVWCDPDDAGSIADAVLSALAEPLRSCLIAKGHQVASRHEWIRSAEAHLPTYQIMREVHYA